MDNSYITLPLWIIPTDEAFLDLPSPLKTIPVDEVHKQESKMSAPILD